MMAALYKFQLMLQAGVYKRAGFFANDHCSEHGPEWNPERCVLLPSWTPAANASDAAGAMSSLLIVLLSVTNRHPFSGITQTGRVYHLVRVVCNQLKSRSTCN